MNYRSSNLGKLIIGIVLLSIATIASAQISFSAKNKTIRQVVKMIQQKSDYAFFYSNDLAGLDKTVSLVITDESIESVLKKTLQDSGISYRMDSDKQITLFQQNREPQSAQEPKQKSNGTVKITGVVKDASSGEVLPGVSVLIEGSRTGIITDLYGRFVIEVPSASSALEFSYIGYGKRKVTVNSQAPMTVNLEQDMKNLNEVVVIGYGTQRKGDVTSSVASLKGKDFTQGNVQDVGQLMQGKVAGLTIYSVSGDPTANTQIKLRGNSTLSGTSTNPLVLIDGIPGDFNSVLPTDIESIDVLKDGSAAAIYGTQGTNGVILITTKRASGKTINSVEYSGYITTQTIARQLDMSTAADVRAQIADGYRSATDNKGYDTDWLKQITRTPFSHVHNLTFRGGTEQTNYLFSANYRSMQGIFLKSDNKIGNFRADINHSMFDNKLKINIGGITRYNKYTTTGDGYSFNGYTYRQALIYNPTAPVKNSDGSWYEETGAFNYDNPLARIKESDGENSTSWSRVNSTITFQPINDLRLSAQLSYSKYNEMRGYYETKNNISTKRSGLNGYASNGTVESVDRTADLTAEYSKVIGDHSFKLLGGYSYRDNNYRQFWEKNVNFPTDAFGYNDISLGTGITTGNANAGIGSSKTVTNLIAFFGRATYNYKDKYLFMGSLRREAASQLVGTKNPWGTFPAASVGWRISKESFMQGVKVIDDLKLRAGYGVTGSQPSASFLGMSTLSYSGYFYSDGTWKQTLAPARNANPYLSWEEKRESNIGLDYAILNNRISGTIDLYNRQIHGLLMDYSVPVPPNLVSTTLANVGRMENKGIEILVNFVPVKKTNFEWTTSINFSTNSNKLISLSNDLYKNTSGYITAGSTGEPIQTYTHRLDVGGPIGNFYGFKVVDVDENGRWIYLDKNNNRVNSANFARTDENKRVLGNGLPKYYAGWNNTFRYKNFDLTIAMRGAFDFQILNYDRMYLENTQTTAYNRLKSAYKPVFGKAILSTKEDLEFNSYYIENGDYWKIDNITLGYNFKLNSKYIKSLRIYASSLNTACITGYKGIDPEVTVSGLTPGNDYRDKYPTTRSYTLGLNVNF